MIALQRIDPDTGVPIGDLIELPKDLQWSDEFTWVPVVQDFQYSVTGALFLQESTKLKGRNITLIGQDNMGWLTREKILELQALKEIAGATFTLTLPDDTTTKDFRVMFFQGADALGVASVKGFDGHLNEAYFKITSIKFIEVGTLT